MDILTLVTFGLTVTCTLISCGSAVVSYLNARKPASVELQTNVDELIFVVEKMMKEQRKEKMQRVRASTKDSPDTPSDTGGDSGSLPSVGRQMSKAELRAMVRQKAGLQ